MFGRDPVLPLNTLLGPKMRYLGNDMNILLLETMKNMFEIAATNLKMAQERGYSKIDPIPSKLQPGDTVLVQNHTKGPFNPKHVGDYHVFSLKGNQVEVQPSVGGSMEIKHIEHVKYILPADQYIKQIPDYSAFGRKADKIPDLQWQLAGTYLTTNIGQLGLQPSDISTHGVDVDTISHAGRNKYENWCRTTLNSDIMTLQSNINPIVCSATPVSNKV